MPALRAPLVLRRPAGTAVLLAGVLLLAGCGKGEAPAAAGPGAAPPPPPEVGVIVAAAQDIGLVTELPGRVEASRVAQVRARATGIVQRQLFREGSDVKAGQPLFRIDPAPLAAASQGAQAVLARAEANAAQARTTAERYRPLVEANAISRQDYANAVAAQKLAEAEVLSSRASVQTASINLGYATVTAPIAGRIGRALVTEGALVGQADATQLAVVQQIDPVYVNFTQSANDALRLRRAVAGGQYKQAGKDAASVRVLLEDGSEYAQPGKLLFSDLSVDATTGQVTLRAEVPNPRGELLPGLYVRVKLEQAQAANAIAVPQQAVTRTQQGDTLTVVGADGTLAKRTVKISAAEGNRWVVQDGLKPGEQVMVDGFQKLQMLPPGAKVKAVPWTAAGAAAVAAPAPAPAPAPAAKP